MSNSDESEPLGKGRYPIRLVVQEHLQSIKDGTLAYPMAFVMGAAERSNWKMWQAYSVVEGCLEMKPK